MTRVSAEPFRPPGSTSATDAGTPGTRVLPFQVDVPVRSYLQHAFPLSIVSHVRGHEERVHESFIQLFFPDRKEAYDRVLMAPALGMREWERLGFLETREIDLRDPALARPEGLLELLVDALEGGSYAELHVDEFFIPGRPCHGRVHSVHDNLLVGYERPADVFHLAGYAAEYEVARVGFGHVLDGFYRAPWNERRRRFLRLVTPREPVPRPVDAAAVARQLADYLASRPGMAPDEMREARLYWKARRFTGTWGIETYGSFRAYLARQAEAAEPVDLRATRTLWEHKACMLARLRHLEAECLFRGARLFSAPYAPVERAARLLRLAAYEHNARGCRPGPLEEAPSILAGMRSVEEAVLTEALASLRPSRG